MQAVLFRTGLCLSIVCSGTISQARDTEAGKDLKHSTYSFTFNFDEQGWTKNVTVPGFDVCTGGYEAGRQGIYLTPGSNTNSFAFYESPLFDLFSAPSKQQRVVEQKGLADRLFRGILSIHNPNTDPMKIPTLRFRASTEDFQQTSAYIVNSTGDTAGLPMVNGSILYRVWLFLPPGKDTIRLDYDILNFDPSDSPNAKMVLTDAGISGINPVDYGPPDSTLDLDFTTSSHGFSQRSAPGSFGVPEFLHSGTKGLGLHRHPDKPETDPATDFGFWGKEDVTTIYGDSIYRISWTIESDAPSDQKTKVPVFRMRVNTGSLQYGGFLSVDSRDSESIIPTAGNPVTYDQWYRPQEQIEEDSLILSFDMIGTGLEGEDPNIPVYVRSISINRYIF
ncbi:hypothetical protein IT570_13685 [Candidatus Sumerlaeota bacterium]|nr:hypothetical protein [Candidatus Sumerlaeota bacterium]